ncbi:MgtE integral membrane region [Rubrobacter xylanophilus DSM 9941]|uniref:MgtE integral membrane region n=1 Tax=Rubrobacter xylanophilus (strain DSM 9941 / JCM 11954 / NBRC 16129 / PRD-1) TaxID=266117 RepID=Q1AX67_RUBXD|nr:magnesium transporter [Rubrobacter xylanophilus]ABG04011.1 MgtE integral membrane region [Rubrobacter xylanophilus DSM 9941]
MQEKEQKAIRRAGLRRLRPRLTPRVFGYLTEEKETLRQGFAALFVSSVGELAAGIVLAGIEGRLEELVGLAVLIPAAIGMRGAIFGAMGSRISTSIQTGLFSFSLRRGVLAENVLAASVLSLASGIFLAVLAWALCGVLGVRTELSVVDYVIISAVGGILAGVLLLGITLAVSRLSVSRGWDMDNIAAPMLTAAGDILTLPALVAASYLIGIPVFSALLALALAALAAAALLYGFRRGSGGLRRILAESLPILAATGTIMILVGLALEDRLEHFLTFPALLILLPAFLQLGGALGGILASRLASKMHLGLLEPRGLPQLAAVRDFTLTYIFAGGVYVFIGAASHLLAAALGQASPGLPLMAGLTVLAGLLATTASVLAAYYGSAVSYRFGLDPDTYGIPVITASVDLLGFISLIISLVVFGLAG